MGAWSERPGQGVVEPPAGAAKIHHRRAIPSVRLRLFNRRLALGATQAIRMQNLDQIIVTFLLIHQLDR